MVLVVYLSLQRGLLASWVSRRAHLMKTERGGQKKKMGDLRGMRYGVMADCLQRSLEEHKIEASTAAVELVVM